MSRPARRQPILRTALAAALMMAGAAVSVAATPAVAQEQPELRPSRGFNRVYQPIAAIANAEGADYASGRAQLPGVIAAIESADDRFLAGNLAYVLGIKLNERPLQQQGMELMLASGKASPVAAAEINYFLGEWAYDAQEWAKARTHLQAARAGGYTGGNPDGLIAESYFKERQFAQGFAYLEGLIEQRAAAGQPIPESWLRRPLQVALTERMTDDIGKWSALLVAHSPNERNWRDAIGVVSESTALTKASQLDLLRLMALTNTLAGRPAYEAYIDAADPRVMANEVARVLEAGLQAGVFSSGEEYYADIKQIVDERAPLERNEAAQYAAEARGAADGRAARNAGDLYLAMRSFAEAEEMYQLAIQKGGVDRDEALTRLGIVQVEQGKFADARATFAQVAGARAPIARLWVAYIESRA